MDNFIKAAAVVLVTVVMCLILSKQGKDYSAVLVICVSCMIAVVAMGYIQNILAFINKLISAGNLNQDLIEILYKTVGIGFLTEITSMICTDAGNTALAKSIQFLSSAVILWLCIPLFTQLLDLVEGVLKAV